MKDTPAVRVSQYGDEDPEEDEDLARHPSYHSFHYDHDFSQTLGSGEYGIPGDRRSQHSNLSTRDDDIRRSLLSTSISASESIDRRGSSNASPAPASPSGGSDSYFSDAVENDGLDALKEGLSVALGSKDKEPAWFPVAKKEPPQKERSPRSSPIHATGSTFGDDISNDGYTDNIPLASLKPKSRLSVPQIHLGGPHLSPNSQESSFPYSYGSNTPSSTNKRKANLSINTDLEASPGKSSARHLSAVDALPTPSTKKFTDVFSRLSERIAAKGQVGVTPVSEKAPSLISRDQDKTQNSSIIGTDDDIYGAAEVDNNSMMTSNTRGRDPKGKRKSEESDYGYFPKTSATGAVLSVPASEAVTPSGTSLRGKASHGLGLYLEQPEALTTTGSAKRSSRSPSPVRRRWSTEVDRDDDNEDDDDEDDHADDESEMIERSDIKNPFVASGENLKKVTSTATTTQHSMRNQSTQSFKIPPLTTSYKNMHLFGRSLKIFGPDSKIRQFCYNLLGHPLINVVMLVLLILQVFLLTYRQWDPIHLNGYYYVGNNWADYALMGINIAYTFEIGAKIIAYGFYDDKIMYRECGLQYPESVISFRLNSDLLYKIAEQFGFRLRKSRKVTKRELLKTEGPGMYASQQIGGELDVKEIDLDEVRNSPNPFDSTPVEIADIRRKYRYSSYHMHQSRVNASSKKKSFYGEAGESGNATSELTPPESSGNDRRLIQGNTFVKSPQKVRRQIDQLQLKRAFLRSSWHRIDFVSMVTFWLSLLLSIDRYDVKHSVFIFRAISCIRILRLCNLTTGTSTILAAVKLALPQLIDVSLFILCFWIFFGIIGVQSFKSSLTRQCVWTNPKDPSDTFVNSDQYCGSYLNISNSAPMPYIQRDGVPSKYIKGYTCPVFSQCVSGENPYGGTLSYDNIFQSMEIVFVIMTVNTFTDIMYDTMDSDNVAACLFYIFCAFVITVWLINVFIAVIVKSFNITRMQKAQEKLEREGKAPKNSAFKLFGAKFNHNNNEGGEKESIRSYFFSQPERIRQLKNQNVFLKFYYRFEFIWIALICVDLFAQCFRKSDMSQARHASLYRIECAFTIAFLCEIVFRFIIHFPNWRYFFTSKRNCFDLGLVIITSIIIIGPVKQKMGQVYYWFTGFQILRFYRVILFTNLTSKLWMKIMGNFKAIFDLTLFYFILLYLTSIIIARYFEGTIPLDEIDDTTFPVHTLPNAFISLYVITSTENWTEIIYPLQQYAKNVSSRCFGSVLFMGWFVISNSIVLNIFIAVIANALEVSESGKRKQQLLQFIENMTNRIQSLDTETGMLSKLKNKIFKKNSMKEDLEKAVVNLLLSGTAVNDFLDDEDGNDSDVESRTKSMQRKGQEQDSDEEHDTNEIAYIINKVKNWFSTRYGIFSRHVRNPFFDIDKADHELTNFNPADFAKKIITDRKKLISKQNKFLEEHPRFNNVFYVLTPQHKIRRLCQRIVKSSYGERIDGVEPHKTVSELFVIVMFLASLALVFTACYLTPLYRNELQEKHGNWNWSAYMETAFTIFFTFEFAIKVLADGLSQTPNAYLRSSWNMIDLVVLTALWIEMIAFLKNDGNLSRIVRGLKALRALRLLTVSETSKNNFHNTMISGFGKIINAGIISLCLLFPFAIWGLNIFNGRLGACTDGSSSAAQCFNEFSSNEVFNWNVYSPNSFQQPYLEFNRFPTAFATLFEIVSLEGWVDLLQNVMSSTGIGTPQSDYASPFNGVFVILFNFISTIFILTLFVSVIIVNYSKSTGRAYLTDDQISWYEVKNILIQVKASKRKTTSNLNWVTKFCYKLTIERNVYWKVYLNLLLVFHVLALLLESFPTANQVNIVREVIFTITSLSFMINIIMLLIAQGFSIFMKNKWNIFYFFVSFGAFVCTVIGFTIPAESAFINITKLFLVGILAFIIPRSNRLSQLLRFASASLPNLLSLSFTWMIVFLVYAIAMNQIFGLTKIGPNGTDNLNLRSVPKALIMLFRCSFGEGWNYIMVDYTLDEPFCTVGDNGFSDCGNKQYAYILFVSWNLISMYIFLNMFVSLILDSFSYINNRSSYIKLIQREEIRKYKRTWELFDPQGTGYIDPVNLPRFLHKLDGALSFHFYTGSLEIKELCKKWFRRNNPFDPYDITVNHAAIEETFDSMDVPKIRERRIVYQKFIEEALMNMKLHADPGISFTRLLLQLPLYIAFEEGQCLNLIDFLDRRLLLQRVEQRMKTQRAYDIVTTYVVRWKYRNYQKLKARGYDPETPFEYEEPNPFEESSVQTTRDDQSTFFGPGEGSKFDGNVYVPNVPLRIYEAGDSKSKSSSKKDDQVRVQVKEASPNESTTFDNPFSEGFVAATSMEDVDLAKSSSGSNDDIAKFGKS